MWQRLRTLSILHSKFSFVPNLFLSKSETQFKTCWKRRLLTSELQFNSNTGALSMHVVGRHPKKILFVVYYERNEENKEITTASSVAISTRECPVHSNDGSIIKRLATVPKVRETPINSETLISKLTPQPRVICGVLLLSSGHCSSIWITLHNNSLHTKQNLQQNTHNLTITVHSQKGTNERTDTRHKSCLV